MRDIESQLGSYQAYVDELFPAITASEVFALATEISVVPAMHETPEHGRRQRRWLRPAVAFVAAFVVILGAIGVVAALRSNGDVTGQVTPNTPAVSPPAAAATTAPAAALDTTVMTGDPWGRIVFSGEGRRGGIDGEFRDIYLYDFAVSETVNLTDSTGYESAPVLSPDGTSIVFHGVPDGDLDEGNWDIYVMSIDDLEIQQVTTDPAADLFPDWSPDGTQIVFEREFGADGRDLFVINVDGTGERRLTDRVGEDVAAAWSPDGTLIAFASDRDAEPGSCSVAWAEECNIEIYAITPDGSGITRLTDSAGIDGFPEWSPDGRRIVFHSNREGPRNFDVYLMNDDGTEPTRVTSSLAGEGHPSWSPDGQFIVFASDEASMSASPEASPMGTQLYTCRPDVCDPVPLAGTPAQATFPHWSS